MAACRSPAASIASQAQRARVAARAGKSCRTSCSIICTERTTRARQDARGRKREKITHGAHNARRLTPPNAASRRPRPQIFIKTLTGRKQAMTFEPTDEVLQIKRQLQEKEGIQVDQIRLIYSGKQLADDKPLEFYNIQAGGTIHMVLQLRGGGGAP